MRGKEVARLEFYPVNRVVEEPVVDDAGLDVREVVTEDVDSAEMRLETQALEMQARIEAARREARAEAREEWEEELEARVAIERGRVERVCEEFARERSKYFAGC